MKTAALWDTYLRHKWPLGMLAWAMHRVTGIALTLYIFAHLYILSSLRDPARFASMMELTHSPIVKLFEVALLGTVAAHTLNGVRLTAVDLGMPGRLHKPVFWAMAAIWAVVTVFGGVAFLGGRAGG